MDPNELHNNRLSIRRELERGGFGAVYLAEDTRLPGRLVALKENLVATRKVRAQFQREAVLLARLRHPNLPQVTDYFGDSLDRQYLVLDCIAWRDPKTQFPGAWRAPSQELRRIE